ncbi:MAG: hypothetical protein COA74_08475 [Gammaproteobacteria bacterium]|nr:MAG: hypothetical protein COA74_08475 [Gammaproteobacteria bacterium]
MKFDASIPSVQTARFDDWSVEHSPALSTKWLQDLIEFDWSLIDKKDPNVLNINDSSLVVKIESDLGYLAAKLSSNDTLKEMVLNTFSQKSAKRNWQYAHFLVNHQISTPEPLAFLQRKKLGLNYQSWYICRFEEGLTCEDYFLNATSFTPAMKNIISSIVELFRAMKECQVSHGNLNASNLIISQDGPCLIDLDSMSYCSNKKKAEQKWREDLLSFMDNWWQRHDIDKQFRLAFLKQGIAL